MVFSTITFLFFFLPLFMAAYFLTPTIRGKNLAALILSLAFYAWGGLSFLPVLLASIVFNMFAAQYIDRQHGRARSVALAVAVTINLLPLAVFKYTGFLSQNLDAVLRPLGQGFDIPKIALPLGISFFTFHCLSYVIDVYRRRFSANKNWAEVALYISLFPQLVAGPIVRYKTVARQLHDRRHTLGRASVGARMFVIGLSQKVLIADQIAKVVEVVFDHTSEPSMIEAWIGLLAYTLQIYFDFAGYSNIAIGLGLILGFSLPRNFRLPYTSQSITEFWRRWHMSLSSWLRDYLYIPLGGSRQGTRRTYINLVTVFLLCGLWHGASWNFVAWGVWHGAFLVLERVGLGMVLTRTPVAVRWIYALLVVMAGWVLFRSHDLSSAAQMYGGLLGRNGVAGIGFDLHVTLDPIVVLALLVGCGLAVLPRFVGFPRYDGRVAAAAQGVWMSALLALTMVSIASGTYSPFLYFRF